jgi:hypothetical protein
MELIVFRILDRNRLSMLPGILDPDKRLLE